ncbi:myo-inositol-1(or 4)-monophosphatase [Galdieria sulphuraria]|uniref:Inositol-1-monophosphatase n=1 Tax=Galdieria sulphuraria TaxID=130081 RepID=M2WSL5_GALSU|nr:myo-inositol-1(or 4)-monophosphatase [Galdieria sulphuraria]EME26840.1 myo-inositol-1(or 4)-monophosphatase [Galdieria sulphuraria]|eukprot:XP_005703360.1 myo-inositol-1(or 4)-monophosphatase [Galdieria sulphuraria]
MDNLKQRLCFALPLIRQAGTILRGAFSLRKEGVIYRKKTETDPVTNTDIELETFLRKEILSKFPNEAFIGEESASNLERFDQDSCWILDPIDGTANFVHGIPNVAISLAYSERGQVVLGIVYNPLEEELFTAIRGGGAFLEDTPIRVSDIDNWNEAIVCTEFGSDRSSVKCSMIVENLKNILDDKIQGIRATGSAALDLCYVAAGRFDVYYEYGPHIWDIAAGSLIVEEAGGTVLHPTGSNLDLRSRGILATNQRFCKKLKFPPFWHF